jgi:hypothetical protein
MSRPYINTPDRGYQPDMSAVLYAMRDPMMPVAWRLCWSHPGEQSYVMAEGECSAVHHATMAAAVAYGERRYGETAKRACWSA